jgi:hypothetical protein
MDGLARVQNGVAVSVEPFAVTALRLKSSPTQELTVA